MIDSLKQFLNTCYHGKITVTLARGGSCNFFSFIKYTYDGFNYIQHLGPVCIRVRSN